MRTNGKPYLYKDESGRQRHCALIIYKADNKISVVPNNMPIKGIITYVDVGNDDLVDNYESYLLISIENAKCVLFQIELKLGSPFSYRIIGLINAVDLIKEI